MSVNVQRYDLAQHGRVLATRPKGREVGQRAADCLAKSRGLLLSFWGVEVASPSFLDEVLSALRGELAREDGGWLLVVGQNEDVAESLEMVLHRHKMALGALEGDQVRLLGGPKHLADTLAEAQKLGEFTAPDLAERLAIKLPALHQRLNALLEGGALVREDDPSATRGRRGRYTVPDPPSDAGEAPEPALVQPA